MHAEAVRGEDGVIVYLLPGLTPVQRKAALRRLRQEGSRGCGPELPAGQLAAALAADRLRAGVRHTAGAVRLHPVRTLVPTALAGVLVGGFAFGSLYTQVETASRGPVPGGAASWTVPAGPHLAVPRDVPAAGAATARALPTPAHRTGPKRR